MKLYVSGHDAWLLSALLLMTFESPMLSEMHLIPNVYIADVLALGLLAVAGYTFLDSALHASIVGVLALGTIAFGVAARFPADPIVSLELASAVFETALLF